MFLFNKKLYTQPYFVPILLFFIVTAVTIQQYLLGKYNNYLIFVHSFEFLAGYQNPYIHHPEYYFDLYKYSPTFSALMAPFYYLPKLIGLWLWNALNAGILYWGIKKQGYDSKQILIFWGIVLFDFITSLQNSQSNVLIAGLALLAYQFIQEKKWLWGSAFIILGFYIKIFPLALFLLFVFALIDIFKEPQTEISNKQSAFFSIIGISMVCVGIGWALPLLVVDFGQLIYLYQEWYKLLQKDGVISYGISVMGILNIWLGWQGKNIFPEVGSLFIMLIIMLYTYQKPVNKSYLLPFYFASLLLWMVIFNHRGESPTYIIAMTGVAIWWLSLQNLKDKNEYRNTKSIYKPGLDIFLLFFAIILTSLSPTDLFPKYLRQQYVVPYSVKALPCFLIWLRLGWQLITLGKLSKDNL